MKPTTVTQQQMIADFYKEYQVKLVNFALARLGNWQEAEDLVQDVFVKLMTYDGIINKTTIRSFVFTITNHEVMNILRRRACRHKVEENVVYEQELQHCAVERVVEYHDTLRMVNYCVDQLTPSCAKVYRMTLFVGKCAGEIAKELNVSKRTVESQLLTSRKKVRMMLQAI